MGEKAREKEMVPFVGGRLPSMFDEMERLFGRLMGKGFGPSFWPDFRWPEEMEMAYPSVDIFEDPSNVVLKAELPGVRKQDLSVEITDNRVCISGEKKREEKVEKKDYHRIERTSGSFTRSFSLPADVEGAKAKASFKDGVLEVRIPKTAAARKKEVKVSIE
jgi:HSP20 family protein